MSYELEEIKILIENYGEETTLIEIYDDLKGDNDE